jgi:hypothetical protein
MSPSVKISRQDLQRLSTPSSAFITDVKPLSSYNWLEAPQETPTIIVPGSPALWRPSASARKLKQDSGLIYIAQNAARHPDSPLEPLFRAVYTTNPSFDIRNIDVVTDRNNIRKLLSFVASASVGNVIEPFTIDVELAKNTAIFCRTETATYEILGPRDFRGFGHEFEKNYTSSQISGSTGHHRIISYRFGDMKFLLRHEVDGYVGRPTDPVTSANKALGADDLSDILGSLSLQAADSAASTIPSVSRLIIKKGGQEVPLEGTLEIKTRVVHKPIEIRDVAPQLWISQTPKLVRAYHVKGLFQPPTVEDVKVPIKSWEQNSQGELKLLAALIKRVVDAVRTCGGNAVLKYDQIEDVLVISRVNRTRMLPDDLYVKWNDEENGKSEVTPSTSEVSYFQNWPTSYTKMA